MNKLYNEDCFITLNRPELQNNVDIILTSPPYNTSRPGASDKYNKRYKFYKDKITNDEYIKWSVDLFNNYDKILKKDGVILYNLSYSSENTSLIWLTVADIIKNTEFTTADCIIWKKKSAIPNNRSKNKLTRIVEYIFVFVRKSELKSFNSNKKIVSVIKKTGQANYENIYNFIEAKNNDSNTKINKATFSSELVIKLLNIYAKKESIIYDNFIGTGTTAIGCLKTGNYYIGSETDKEQYDYSLNRIKNYVKNISN